MIAAIDRLIDRITMYRLVLWYLLALLGAALSLGALHMIAVNPMALALSAVLVLAGGWIANQIFARIFAATPNIESVYITGLIIVLIMDPAPLGNLSAAGAIVFASAWAMASKFILSLRRRHVFNPAALGVALPALLSVQAFAQTAQPKEPDRTTGSAVREEPSLPQAPIGNVIALEAGLSYLGIGAREPTPSWGSIFFEGTEFLTSTWWIGFFPGVAIVITVLAFNVLGDALRDVLDPRQLHGSEGQAALAASTSTGTDQLKNG